MALLSGLYLVVALSFFGSLFEGLSKSTDLSKEQRECSLKVMSLAAIFWPIVLPISYMEKRSKAQQGFYQPQMEKSQVSVVPELETSPVLLSSKFEITTETEKPHKVVNSLVA
ncbi:MAG TPA: hypothetical protein DCE56_33245 [Cyanobacteria bacterium UBA8553]|nr:hypothetical protein [Cyanobacteria bacterium UBA8553]